MNCGFPLVGRKTGTWEPSKMEIRVLVERSLPRNKDRERSTVLGMEISGKWCQMLNYYWFQSFISKHLAEIYCSVHGACGEKSRSSRGWCAAETEEPYPGKARSQNGSRRWWDYKPLGVPESLRWCWASLWRGQMYFFQLFKKKGLRKLKRTLSLPLKLAITQLGGEGMGVCMHVCAHTHRDCTWELRQQMLSAHSLSRKDKKCYKSLEFRGITLAGVSGGTG